MVLPSTFYLDQNFDYKYLRNRRETYTDVLRGTEPATAGNYTVFAIMPLGGVVEEFWETHGTACSSTGTLQLEKLTSGQALDGGTAVLSTALNLNTTADTPQRGTLSTTPATIQFARGDRFALKDANTLTSTANLIISLVVRYKNI